MLGKVSIHRTSEVAALLLSSLVLATSVSAGIRFENTTAQSGISFSGRSFGASWGDINTDGWADAWTGNHRSNPHLYLNNKDGTFSELLGSAWTNPISRDGHGAAFADVDNDGDQDLVQLSGGGSGHGSSPNLLLANNGFTFTNIASDAGISVPLGRGRTPLWLDWNGDGQLDLLVANLKRPDGKAPTKLYLQQSGLFTATSIPAAADTEANLFAQLAHLSGTGAPQVIFASQSVYPTTIYTVGDPAPGDQRSALNIPVTNDVRDVAIADFNGDLLPDFFLATMETSASEAEIYAGNSVRLAVHLAATQHGVDFQTSGNVRFQFGPSWAVGTGKVFIGANGYHPASTSFQLSPDNPANQGMLPHTAGKDFGYYISYVPSSQTWRVRISKSSSLSANMQATATAPIRSLSKILGTATAPRNDRLLLSQPSGWIDTTAIAGLQLPTSCESAAAGDFDNDMDVDLYVVCASLTSNTPNLLYENDGNGVFTNVEHAGGAAGQTTGRGDSVAVADYDNDGYLDLLVTNGSGEPPFTIDGSTELFRNQGGVNNWIAVDLQGVASNRDGVGARVLASAGGITQVREQNNGVHLVAQNHQRLHFGLGANEQVDLRVEWPSGQVDELTGLAANSIYRLIEGGEAIPTGMPELP